MKTISEYTVEKAVRYHIDNGLPLQENIFRTGTKLHFKLIEAIKDLYQDGLYEPINEEETEILQTDIGEWVLYDGTHIPLDYPMININEEKDPELESPKRGGNKKFYVYVRNPKTKNIMKIEWGDTTGLKMKISDPEARKSFAARHQCHLKKDKTKAGWWACNTPRYGKQLGLSPESTGDFFW